MFAVNPSLGDVTIHVGEGIAGAAAGAWEQLADHERFFASEGHGATLPVEPDLFVPALGCALWRSDE